MTGAGASFSQAAIKLVNVAERSGGAATAGTNALTGRSFDDQGDLDRKNFRDVVKQGQQGVTAAFPPLGAAAAPAKN